MLALNFINNAGEMTPKELSALLEITTGSMTAMVDRLEAAALVTRNPQPTDRRSLLLTLASAGRHATQWAQDVFENAIASVCQQESNREAAADAAFLATIAEALNQAARLQKAA
ncbi:hypothetical protein CVS27_11310 [Arthrobacter glacialis]|uniref:HTH marR-type domain-containing protein n=1 Tax=Arthrobacter glacialis TaxID=1664 RepID=A0A2S3ZV42_ARTGL|nr:hypothetical protein CVS27_11310 [Arthrobacter glacialis]